MEMGHYGASKKLFAALVLLIINWEEWEGRYKERQDDIFGYTIHII